VSGGALGSGLFITSIDSATQFTLSDGALTGETTDLTYGGNVLARSGAIEALTVQNSSNVIISSGTAGLTVGQAISGQGIPAGATILAIRDGNNITLGVNGIEAVATETVNASMLFGTYIAATTTNGSPTVTVAGGTAGLTTGQAIFGAGIPANATILSIVDGSSIIIGVGGVAVNATADGSGSLIVNSNSIFTGNRVSTTESGTLVTVADTSALVVGQAVSGSGIAPGSVITRIINETSFEVSSPLLLAGQSSLFLDDGSGSGAVSMLTVNSDNSFIFGGSIRNGLGGGQMALTKTGNGILSLTSNLSNYSGPTIINGGGILVRKLDFGGFSSPIGASSNAAANLVLNGGFLRFSDNAPTFTDRSFTLGTGDNAGALIADGTVFGATLVFGINGLSPNVEYIGSGSRTLTLGGANRGDNQFNLVLGDGQGGPTSLSKIGNGTWVMGATSSYTGETVVYAGILAATANGAFGATGAAGIIIAGGTNASAILGNQNATVDLRNVSYDRAQTLYLAGGTLATTTGTSSWAGPVFATANSNLHIEAGASLELKGVLGGSGGLVQRGGGTLILSGQVDEITRNFSGSATTAGVPTFTLQAGTLVLDYSTNDNSKLSDKGALVLGGSRLGGTLVLTGDGTEGTFYGGGVGEGSYIVPEHIEIVAGLTVGAGNNRIVRETELTVFPDYEYEGEIYPGYTLMTPIGNAIIRLNGISRQAGATIDFSHDNLASTDTNNVNGILGGWATVGGGTWALKSLINDSNIAILANGQDGLIRGLLSEEYVKSGASSAATSFNAAVSQNNFTADDWVLNANMDIIGNSTQNARSTNSIRFNDTNGDAIFGRTKAFRVTLSGTNTIQSGGILVTQLMGSLDAVIDGPGTLVSGLGNTQSLNIIQNNTNGGLLHISAVIANASGVVNGLDKNGPGGLILSGMNTFTGTTSLNDGVLTVGNLAIQGYGAATAVAAVRPSLGRTITVANTYGLTLGQTVTGAELPAGVTITAINSPTSISLSNGALITTTGASLTYGTNVAPKSGAIEVNTTVNSATVTVPGGTAGLSVGQSIAAVGGIPAGVTILSITNSTTITIGQSGVAINATATGTISPVFGDSGVPTVTPLVLASNTQSGALLTVGSTLGMTVGQTVSGTGIAGSSVIVRILDDHTVELSNPVTSTGQNNITFGTGTAIGQPALMATTTSGSAAVTVTSTAGLSVGQAISGPGIPVGATVAAILSPTEILISVAALYTGSNLLAFAGPQSNLGASGNALANLVFNGGVLQFNGTSMRSDRGFTINKDAIWDVGNAYTQLTVGGNWGTQGIEDVYSIVKRGSGTLELLGTIISGYGLEKLVVEGGTLRLRAAISDQYIRNDVGSLVMGGGTLDLSSVTGRATTQNMIGAFVANTGASVVRVTATGNENTILNLQDVNSPDRIVFNNGSTVLFHEIQSLTGTGEARITLAGQFGVDVQVIIPRAVYQSNVDSIRPGVNNFAFVDATGYNIVGSDLGAAAHTIQGNLANWTAFMNVQDGALASDAFQGTTLAAASVNTIRFFNSSYAGGTTPGASTVTISDILTLNSGAILQTTHAGNHQNSFVGGALTSSLSNNDDTSADLIVHNWNPHSALVIASSIIDNSAISRIVNLVQTGDGTTALAGSNSYTGTTYVHGGVLRIDSASALPAAGQLRMNGGVLGINADLDSNNAADFTWSIFKLVDGVAEGQVAWTGSGGFAAYTLDRTVNLGGNGAVLKWGGADVEGLFVRDNFSLILGAQDADKTLIFANAINLGRKSRMIEAISGRGTAEVDGRITGVISGDAGRLVKGGNGVLELTGNNTYSGGTS
ncbi:MAG: autotransporter-associated beta strand repeat-containing protein, partial [Gammaproteobacteria bacterium]|nr:autotransporter-associated beta strand repeat-containing protein [Gammaproteobacteria bacterium]